MTTEWQRLNVPDMPAHLTEGRNEWRRQNWQSFYVGATSKIVAHRLGGAAHAHRIVRPETVLMKFSCP